MKKRLAELLDQHDQCKVECDGFVRIASHELSKAEIPHKVLSGCARVGNEGDETLIPLHFWIEVDDGEGSVLTVDYRLRMWAGSDAPHGVFYNESVDYHPANELSLQTDSKIIDLLTASWPSGST